jgi:hypothetical protein
MPGNDYVTGTIPALTSGGLPVTIECKVLNFQGVPPMRASALPDTVIDQALTQLSGTKDNALMHARVSGKFLTVGGERHLIRGVSYGTFAPDQDGVQFPTAARIAQDFALMAAAGINTVRIYTPPPVHLLDEAARHGLRVMIGLPWSQHVAFLGDRDLARRIRRETAQHVRTLGSHPAALLFAVGNEIPPSAGS